MLNLVLWMLVMTLAAAAPAAAQYWENQGRPFRAAPVSDIATDFEITAPNLATGADGTTAFGLQEGASLLIRRFLGGRTPQVTPFTIPTGFAVGTSFALLPDRSAVVTGVVGGDVVVQRTDRFGRPVGDPFRAVVAENPFDTAAAPIRDGFVVVWDDQARGSSAQRFTSDGIAIGGTIDLGPDQGGELHQPSAEPLANGGFLATWGAVPRRIRAFDADGAPLSNSFSVGPGLGRLTDVAVSADGTRVAATSLPPAGDPAPNEVRVRIFTIDGTVLHDLVPGTTPVGAMALRPSVAFDLNGNLVVVWGAAVGAAITVGDVYAQAYDPAGAPVRPARLLQTGRVYPSLTAVERRMDGGFMAFWREDFDWHAGVRFTLCEPGSAVCGDGVRSSTCEVCDDGAGNSDTAPDACRTDCRPARCGDGVADAGEACDDGNDYYCDGCTPLCIVEPGVVCGDGIVPDGCNEQCDDTNTVAGDGCGNDCKIERVLGGGSVLSDCWSAWRVENPSNLPLYDSRGRINRKQRCRDGDPACDFDAITGQCTFHVSVCVNNAEPRECDPQRLLAWSVRKPSAKHGAKTPALAAIRSALEGAVLPNVVGAATANLCSPAADVTVPLKGVPGAYKATKLTLAADAETYDGRFDRDTLALRCDPAD